MLVHGSLNLIDPEYEEVQQEHSALARAIATAASFNAKVLFLTRVGNRDSWNADNILANVRSCFTPSIITPVQWFVNTIV